MTKFAAPTTLLGRPIGPIGFGLMGFTRPWAPTPYDEAVKVMKTALDNGANFWNGGMFYGTPESNSLHLLKHYFTKYPEDADKVVLSIKGALNVNVAARTHTPDCSPEGIRASVAEAMRVLDGVKKIDIFECARVDPNVPIETSIKALGELVAEGKIGGIGLSEVSAATIRRAQAVHPVAAVEIELSFITPDPLTNGIAETCRELDVAMVAYSPLGRGFLTGEVRKFDDFAETDFRRRMPRFQPDVFDENLKLVEAVEHIAKRKGVTSGQAAIAWTRYYGAVPIPGATKEGRVLENTKDCIITDQDAAEIQTILDRFPIQGPRYGGEAEKLLNQ